MSALDAFGTAVETEALAPSTRAGYEGAVFAFERFCKVILLISRFPPVGEAGVIAVLRYYAYVLREGNKFASIKKARSAITDLYFLDQRASPCNDRRTIFRYQRFHDFCRKFRPEVQAKFIPEEVVAAVLLDSVFPSRGEELIVLAFVLMYLSAVRSGTLLRLRPCDVSLSKDSKSVRIVWVKVKGHRNVPVSREYPRFWSECPSWWSLLSGLLGQCPPFACLFRSFASGSLSEGIRSLCRAQGMDVEADEFYSQVRAHSLRRTRAKVAEAAGASEVAIASLLMQASVSAQRPYLRISGTLLFSVGG